MTLIHLGRAPKVEKGCESHIDCRQFNGPFTIIDCDSDSPARRDRFHSVRGAFRWADKRYANTDRDFVVQDRSGNVITRREGSWSWLQTIRDPYTPTSSGPGLHEDYKP